MFCRISHIISSLSREQTLRPRRECKEFILEAVLGNSGRWVGDMRQGKQKQPIMGEFSSKFPLWMIGTYSHWAILGASVEHATQSYPSHRGNWCLYTSYQSLVEGGVNCLALQPPQVGQWELREGPQAKGRRRQQPAVGRYITTVVRLEWVPSGQGLRLLYSTNTGILFRKIGGESPVKKLKTWLEQK